MRALCFLFLLALVGAVGAFAWFNRTEVPVQFFNWSESTSVAVIAGVAYVLGMLSGWSVVGMIRRSINQVTYPTYQGRTHNA